MNPSSLPVQGAAMPIHLSNAWKSGAGIINHVISLLPNLILACVVFVLFFIAGKLCKSLVERVSNRRQARQNVALLLGRLAQTLVLVLGFLIAVAIVAPSFRAGDLIKMLGIGGVAIGFAFQNILQNFLAGILLLLNEPFRIGDQINVTGLEGKVEEIQARATIVTSPDGDKLVIPNATLFTNPVTVRRKKTGVLAEEGQEGEK